MEKIVKAILVFVHLLMLFTSVMALPENSKGAEFLLELNTGFDSNPGERSDAEGSGYVSVGLILSEAFVLNERLALDILSTARYKDFWELDDQQRFSAKVSLSPLNPWGVFIPSLYLEAEAFRDEFYEKDEYNLFAVGTQLEWLISGRYTFRSEAVFRKHHYLTPSVLFPKTMHAEENPHCPECPYAENKVLPARSEDKMALEAGLTVHVSPVINTGFDLVFNRLDSSSGPESYTSFAPELYFEWEITSVCSLFIDVSLEYRRYGHLGEMMPGPGRKNNRIYTLEIMATRHFGQIELFGGICLEKGEYPLNNAEYTRQVMQCGFSLPF